MEKDEIIKLFYEFLVKNNALFIYLKYANIPTVNDICHPTFFMLKVLWSETKEGYDYWDKLDDEFDKILKQNNLYEHN